MDQVLKDTLTANLKAAKTPDAKLDALVLSEIAVIDCQHKTSARVKELVEDRGRRKWLAQLIQGLYTSGGFLALAKLCQSLGLF